MSATNAMPVAPLIRRPAVYRRKFKLPNGGGQGVAELHEDRIVIRRVRGRRKYEVPFTRLWASWTGELL